MKKQTMKKRNEIEVVEKERIRRNWERERERERERSFQLFETLSENIENWLVCEAGNKLARWERDRGSHGWVWENGKG